MQKYRDLNYSLFNQATTNRRNEKYAGSKRSLVGIVNISIDFLVEGFVDKQAWNFNGLVFCFRGAWPDETPLLRLAQLLQIQKDHPSASEEDRYRHGCFFITLD
jgi:hypothetical protein